MPSRDGWMQNRDKAAYWWGCIVADFFFFFFSRAANITAAFKKVSKVLTTFVTSWRLKIEMKNKHVDDKEVFPAHRSEESEI